MNFSFIRWCEVLCLLFSGGVEVDIIFVQSNEGELDMLRVKNKTKNNIITRLREINHASEIEKQALRAELRNLHAEGVMNKVIMGARIRELENKLRYAQEEASYNNSNNFPNHGQARNRQVCCLDISHD